jgi:transcriptional regulator with XRE-family HTH domain
MLNIEAFLERLEILMQNNQLNATAFAEKIGVQRSSVSHILSKRNKPSLEFMLKIHEHFEEANLDWLILGGEKKSSPTLTEEQTEVAQTDLFSNKQKEDNTAKSSLSQTNLEAEKISQIIQLYKDGSFRTYFPKS